MVLLLLLSELFHLQLFVVSCSGFNTPRINTVDVLNRSLLFTCHNNNGPMIATQLPLEHHRPIVEV